MRKFREKKRSIRKEAKFCFYMWVVMTSVLFVVGCASNLTKVSSPLPTSFEKIGQAKGDACGTLIGGPTAYNILPIYLNERVERAYQSALNSIPSATALMNVTMQEYWFWWAVGTTRCVTITGEAIR